MKDQITRLPRADATLSATYVKIPGSTDPHLFVRDEHDDYWFVIGNYPQVCSAIQRHTSDGWVAALFHDDDQYLRIVPPGECHPLRNGNILVSIVHRNGIRWTYRGESGWL